MICRPTNISKSIFDIYRGTVCSLKLLVLHNISLRCIDGRPGSSEIHRDSLQFHHVPLHKSHQLEDLQAWWLHTIGSGMSAYHDSWQQKLLPICCLFVMSKSSPTHTLAAL